MLLTLSDPASVNLLATRDSLDYRVDKTSVTG